MNRNLFNQSAIVVIDNVQRMNDNKVMKPFKSADGKTYYQQICEKPRRSGRGWIAKVLALSPVSAAVPRTA